MLTTLRRSPELVVVPLAAWLLHLATWQGYGWFRDELYYVACARHMAWGYVDHPPLSIAIVNVLLRITGPSLFAMRAVVGLASALTVLMVGLVTQELGGRSFARVMAMTAVLIAPTVLALGFFYSMNAFDVLLWPAAVYLLLRALRHRGPSWWMALGIVLGLGLLNKASAFWLGGGIAVALLMTPSRASLRSVGPWLAGAIAAVMLMPHLVWQWHNSWPTLEFIRNAGRDKMIGRTVTAFAAAVASEEGIHVVIFGLAGLAAAFSGWIDRRARIIFWIWASVFVLLAANRTSRVGYLTPAWCLSFALGGLWIERLLRNRTAVWRGAAVAVLLGFGAVALPLAIPVLPTDSYVRYAAKLGVAASTEEKKDVARLGQFFADMNGWDSIVSTVSSAWMALPADRRQHTAFFGTNYGESAAVDVLGRPGAAPTVIGSHNNYFLWGPPGDEIDGIIIMSQNPARWSAMFGHVELVGQTDCGDCMPYENHRSIYAAWGRKAAWASLWPSLKHYD